MTVEEFAWAIVTIRRRHRGSVTSWGRSSARSVSVGGFQDDPHDWDRGVDLIYDDGPPEPFEVLQAEARALGLKVIRETGKPHDHYQPLDFPAGPVTEYDGELKTWA